MTPLLTIYSTSIALEFLHIELSLTEVRHKAVIINKRKCQCYNQVNDSC